MASAISRTILSLTWLRNLFQLFHPIGGVLANPFDFTGSGFGSDTAGGRGGRGPGASLVTRSSSNTCGAGGAFFGASGAGPRPGPGPRPAPNAGLVSFILPPSSTAASVTF